MNARGLGSWLFCVTCFLLLSASFAFAGFPEDWSSNAEVTVDNRQNASALSNHQVKVYVRYQSGMNADFSDLRFASTNSSPTPADLLSHWVESSVASSHAIVWVKVPTVTASAVTTIYLYYGNAGAATASDISATMIFGDDFSGASVDLAKWAGNTGNFAVGSGLLSNTGTTSFSINTISTFSGPIVLESRTKGTTFSTNGQTTLGFYVSGADSLGFVERLNGAGNRYYLWHDATLSAATTTFDLSQWHRLSLKVDGSNNVTGFFDNGLFPVFTSPANPAAFTKTVTNESIRVGNRYDAVPPAVGAYAQQWDWILTRTYTSPEPVSYVDYPVTGAGALGSSNVTIAINNASGPALTNYAVVVTMNTAAQVTAGFMNASGNDIRFVDSDNTTLLWYWIETGTMNTATTRVWVKVPSIPAGGSKNIFMYYNNGAASAFSNAEKTFLFGDDFSSGASADTGLWFGNTGTFTISGGLLSGTNTTNVLQTYQALTQPMILEARSSIPTDNNSIATNGEMLLGTYTSGLDHIGVHVQRRNPVPGANTQYRMYNNAAGSAQVTTPSLISTFKASMSVDGSGNGTTTVTGASVTSQNFVNTVTNEQIRIGRQYTNANLAQAYTQTWDWIFARKYNNPEPSTSIATWPITKLAFTTASQTIYQNSTVMTVQTQDAASTAQNVSADTTVDLSSTSGTGEFSLTTSPWTPITSVTIPTGSNSVSFYYKDTTAGTPTITADENPSQGWTAGTQNETVNLLHLGPYQSAITIDNSSGSSQTNYQVLIPMNTQSIIALGKMQADGRDIRFIDSDNFTVLSYWIEEDTFLDDASSANDTGINRANTRVWVKIPSLPAGTKTITMYYGDSAANALSNIGNTMAFGDDFSGGSVDLTKWTSAPASFSLSGGALTGTLTTDNLLSISTFTGEYAVEAYSKAVTFAANGQMTAGFFGTTANGVGLLEYTGGTGRYYYRNNGAWVGPTNFDMTTTFHKTTLGVDSAGNASLTINNGTSSSVQAFANAGGISAEAVRIGERYDNGNTGQAYNEIWNWIFVRKYQATQPTVSIAWPVGKLVFTTATQTIYQNSTVMTVQTQSDDGTVVNVSADTTINLSSTSGAGEFSVATSPFTPVTSVTIPSGSSSVSFYYKDTTVGTPTLTADESPSQGWTAATQSEVVNLLHLGSYQSTITIDNSAGSSQTDYQVLVSISTQAVIALGRMQADGRDIRFIDSDNFTVLSYWIEEDTFLDDASAANDTGINRVNTRIWVKLPSLPAATKTITIYYGDSAATALSNITRTMAFGDDFSGGSVDLAKWTSAPAQFSVSGSQLTGVSSAATPQNLLSLTAFTAGANYGYAVETYTKTNTFAANGIMTAGFYGSAANSAGFLEDNGGGAAANGFYNYRNDGALSGNTNFNLTSTFHSALVAVDQSANGYVSVNNGTLTSTSITFVNSGISNEAVRIGQRYNNPAAVETYNQTWNWICVRKYQTTQPTVTIDWPIGKLMFTTAAQTIYQNSTAITVQTQGDDGVPVSVSADTTISLSSTSGTGQFSVATSPFTPVTSVTIPSGSNFVTFYYRDTTPGAPTITADESPSQGWVAATQNETVNSLGLGTYRVPITLNNSAGTSQTDYQVLVTLNTQAIINKSKMQADGADIRFLDADDFTVLSYWIEDTTFVDDASTANDVGINKSTTRIWVKVPSLPASSKTIYLYYGNSGASAYSSITNTMAFGDDFNAGSIDLAKWTSAPASFSVASGLLTGTLTTDNLQSIATFTGGYAVEAYSKAGALATNGQMTAGFFASTANGVGLLEHSGGTGNLGRYYYRNNGAWPGNINFDLMTYFHKTMLGVDAAGNASLTLNNGTTNSAQAFANAGGISAEYVRLGERYDNGNTGQVYNEQWDWIFVRKYQSTALPVTINWPTSNLVFTAKPSPIYQNSTAMTVESRGDDDTPVNMLANTTIAVSSTSGTGQFSAATSPFTPVSGVTMPSGQSTVSFYYQDTTAGTPTITADESPSQGWTADSYTPTVNLLSLGAYKTAITVDNSAGSAQTNYQVAVTLNTASIVALGKMLSSGADIRFLDSDDFTVLSYWIEEDTFVDDVSAANDTGINRINTRIWVKLPSLPAGTKTFYLYYGSPSATAYSNITNTMTFGDDFNAASIDLAKWTSAPASFSISGSDLLVGTLTTDNLQSIPSFTAVAPYGYAVEAYSKATTFATNGQSTAGFWAAAANGVGLLEYPGGAAPGTGRYYYRNNNAFTGPTTFDLQTYFHRTTLGVDAAGAASLTLNNGTVSSVQAFANAGSLSAEYVRLGQRYDNGNAGQAYNEQWDWIFVRKYQSTATTPAVTWTVGKIVFTTAAQTIYRNSTVMTVQTQSDDGTAVNVSSNTTLSLSSTSGTGQFSLLTSPFTPVTSVTIPSGSNTVSFYYKDTTPGTPTITVDENPSQSWLAATQVETVLDLGLGIYRIPVTLTNASASPYINGQFAVTLNTSTIVSAGRMQSDGDDIRFLDSDDFTVLSNWIEEPTMNSTATKIWIKLPSFPVGTKTIYLYYGDPSATVFSNITNTMIFGDDFKTGSIDLTKWTSAPAQFSVSGGILTGTNTTGILQSISTHTSPFIMETRTTTALPAATNGQMILGVRVSNADNVGIIVERSGTTGTFFRPWEDGALVNPQITFDFFGGWTKAKLTVNAAGVGNTTIDLVNDNLQTATTTPANNNAITNCPVRLGQRYNNGNAGQAYNQQWDWVFVRQNCDTGVTTAPQFPASKLVLTGATTLLQDRASAYTIQTQDDSGNPVNVSANTTINFSSTSSGGEFSLLSSPFTPVTSATILSGQNSVTVYYRDSAMGSATLTGDESPSQSWTAATKTVNVIDVFRGDYYRAITITNAGGALTNYQIVAVVDTATSIVAGHMNANGYDFRVYDSDDQTLLYHWVETPTINTASTRLWVNVPSIPSGSKTIYLYYGDPAATISSDIEDISGTMIFGDHFGDNTSGLTVDTAKWGGNTSNFALSGTGSLLGNNVGFYLQSQNIFNGPIILETRTQTTTPNAAGELAMGFYQSRANNTGLIERLNGGTTRYRLINNATISLNVTFNTFNNWHKINMTTNSGGVGSFVADDTSPPLTAAIAYNNPIANERIRLGLLYDNSLGAPATYAQSWDWIFSRQYDANFVAGTSFVNVGVETAVIKKMAFTTSPQTLIQDQFSSLITLQTQDVNSVAKPVTADQTVNLTSSSSTGRFSLTTSPWSPITQVTIPAGQNSVSFFYKDTAIGTPTLTAVEAPSMGWTDATQSITIGQRGLYFSTNAQTTIQDVVSSIITIETGSSAGFPVPVTQDVTIQLSSTSPTGQFSLTSSPITSITSVLIPAGASSVSFFYKDITVGTFTLTASENPSQNWLDATQSFIVQKATDHFVLSVPASGKVVAGAPFAFTVTAVKADNTPFTLYTGTLTFSITYTDPLTGTETLQTQTVGTFVNGVANVTASYGDAGKIRITAVDAADVTILGIGNEIEFVPDHFSVTPASTTQVVNKPFDFTIQALNAQGAATPNFNRSVAVSFVPVTPAADQGGILTPAQAGFTAGASAITGANYTKWGSIQLVVTDPLGLNADPVASVSTPVSFHPNAFKLTVSAPSPHRTYFYLDEEFQVTVATQDFAGAPISNYGGILQIPAVDGLSLPVNSYLFTPEDLGQHTFTVKSGTEGEYTISVSDSVYAEATGISEPLKSKFGKLVIESKTVLIGDVQVLVKLVDRNGLTLIEDDSSTFLVKLAEEKPETPSSLSNATVTPVHIQAGLGVFNLADSEAEKVTVSVQESTPSLSSESGVIIFTEEPIVSTIGKGGLRLLFWKEDKEESGE